MSSPSSSDSVDIEISKITISSTRVIASIDLSIGGTKLICKFEPKDKKEEATLAPPAGSIISSSTPLIVVVSRESGFPGLHTSKTIKVRRQDLLPTVDANKREYRTKARKIEVVIEFIARQVSKEGPVATRELRPTTDKIFEICPRFRVLVIGRTGTGKTSLIKDTFGVTDALTSHGAVGECDINDELYSSDENKRFVLHDSMGFEPGDEGNFDMVINFLNDRKEKPDIKDHVHAVWLCFSIPIAGDRLFETGAEKFLQSLSEGNLGKMPIIAIFTKYDQLVDHIRIYDESVTGPDDEEAKVKAKLDQLCVTFREQIGERTKIPEIAVSTEDDYKWTLYQLTQLTTDLVREYLTEDVAVLSAIAQQVSPAVKLDAVIAVGKKRYWQGIVSTMMPGNETDTVLENIHQDIVIIWNLQDPKRLLDSKEFKALVAAIVTEQDVLSLKEMGTSLSMLAALAGIVSALAGPAAPIVIPIAATLVVTHWTILLLKQANIVLQRLMAHIVALTLIMQLIFAITTSTKNVVSRRLIKLALHTFLDSSQNDVISTIKHYLQYPGAKFDRKAALQKITNLIESHRMSPDDIAEVKNMLKDVVIQTDEAW